MSILLLEEARGLALVFTYSKAMLIYDRQITKEDLIARRMAKKECQEINLRGLLKTIFNDATGYGVSWSQT